jgi:hypothetical protein
MTMVSPIPPEPFFNSKTEKGTGEEGGGGIIENIAVKLGGE